MNFNIVFLDAFVTALKHLAKKYPAIIIIAPIAQPIALLLPPGLGDHRVHDVRSR